MTDVERIEIEAPDLRGLRVLEFCDYYGPDSAGGSERVAREVNRVLVDLGARVTVVSAWNGVPYDDPGIRVWPRRGLDLTPVVGAQLMLSPGYARSARRGALVERPHVLYAHSLHFQGSLAAAYAARRLKIPFVAVMHVGSIDAMHGRARLLAEAHERSVGRFVLSSSDAVIAVSAEVADHGYRRGARAGSIAVASNGVDHRRFAPAPAWDGPPTILALGRLVENKGVQVLLEAARRLWARGVDLHLTFVGDGPLRAELERSCRGEPVHFVGQTQEVPHWLRRATVVARPSFTEGMPLAVLEAMAARRCVVVSDIPAHANMVRHLQTGLVHRVGDAEDLAAKLAMVLAHPELRERLAVAGHMRAASLTWQACGIAHARVLADAARGRTADGARRSA